MAGGRFFVAVHVPEVPSLIVYVPDIDVAMELTVPVTVIVMPEAVPVKVMFAPLILPVALSPFNCAVIAVPV
jgi:hypothetical protein